MYKNESDAIGFKQIAFAEFLASLEIYHNSREKYYPKLTKKFNDINWQNTAIFYAGHSKELEGMIDEVINGTPAQDINDYFILSGGFGYLAQALYQTTPEERRKLVLKGWSTYRQLFLRCGNFRKIKLPFFMTCLCHCYAIF